MTQPVHSTSLPSELIHAATRAAINHAVFLWQRCPPDGLPDLFGAGRIFVISASWRLLRRLLADNGDPRIPAAGITIDRACPPRRPLQSIAVSGWENALRDALLSRADLPPAARFHAADSWRFIGVQRAAHEAAAAVLRAFNVRCYVSVEMD